jgi:hypothetical protein
LILPSLPLLFLTFSFVLNFCVSSAKGNRVSHPRSKITVRYV